MGFSVLLKVVEIIANLPESIVTCEIILTNMYGGGNLEIWLTCKGNGAGSDTTMDWGP